MRGKVDSGLYNNASEVIREALRLKIETERAEEVRLQSPRDAVGVGWQQAERGEFSDYSLERSIAKLGNPA